MLVSASSLLHGGCSPLLTPAPETSLIERDGVSVIVEVPSDKTAMIKTHGHMDRFCASRSTDFAEGGSVGVGLGLGYGGAKEETSVSSSVNELALGGRNPAVLIVRELMYRACEMTTNINATAEQTIAVYRNFLEHADTIAATQVGLGSSVGSGSSSSSASSGEGEMAEDDSENDDNDDAGY